MKINATYPTGSEIAEVIRISSNNSGREMGLKPEIRNVPRRDSGTSTNGEINTARKFLFIRYNV